MVLQIALRYVLLAYWMQGMALLRVRQEEMRPLERH